MKIIMWKNPYSVLGKIIVKLSGGPYYHAELLFSDNKIFTASTNPKWGTAFYDYSPNSHQEAFELDFTPEEEAKIRAWAETENGCWYDLVGLIFAAALPFGWENSRWWFCSEMVTAAMQQVGLLTELKAYRTSPTEFISKMLETRRIKVPGEPIILKQV